MCIFWEPWIFPHLKILCSKLWSGEQPTGDNDSNNNADDSDGNRQIIIIRVALTCDK